MQGDSKGYSAETAACIDAETLAAWAEGELPAAQAASVEVHLADCARCAAMLATFVRTMPAEPVSESLWRRWHLRWLVPVATAATVAALWVLIPRPEPVPPATLDSASTAQPQTPAPSSPPRAFDTGDQAPTDARTQSAPPTANATRESARRDEAKGVEEPQARADEAFAPTARAVAPAAPPAPAREADQADRNAAQPERNERMAATAPSQPAAAAAAPAPAEESRARSTLTAPSARQAFAPLEVVSPDPMTRWRVVGPGRVERSTTGGAQWQPATLPESTTLTGGSSPSPSICWLVGRTGAVYVTTDGLRFVRIPSPDRSDFVSIQASDAQRATVVTIDGRTFRTEDQGATWLRVAP